MAIVAAVPICEAIVVADLIALGTAIQFCAHSAGHAVGSKAPDLPTLLLAGIESAFLERGVGCGFVWIRRCTLLLVFR